MRRRKNINEKRKKLSSPLPPSPTSKLEERGYMNFLFLIYISVAAQQAAFNRITVLELKT